MSATLTLSSYSVTSGGHITLSWDCTLSAGEQAHGYSSVLISDSAQDRYLVLDATNPTYTGGAGFNDGVHAAGSVQLSPTASTTYTLFYQDGSGHISAAEASAMLAVAALSVAGNAGELVLVSSSYCAGVITTGGPIPPTSGGGTGAASASFLTVDPHRRPLAATATGGGALGYYSNDAGHAFAQATIDPDPTCADVSLLLDRHGCTFAAVYTKGKPGSAALYSAFGPVADSFVPSTPPVPLAGVNGLSPICCEHPTDRQCALMALVSGGSLMAAESGDGCHTWTAAGRIAGGVDFSTSGRAGLCVLGETAFCAFASGSSVNCAKSPDRGQTWTATQSAGAGVNGTYSGVSLLGWQGTLYLLVFLTPPGGTAPVPVLFTSGSLGDTWTKAPGAMPAGLTLPSAIGVIPHSGQLRLDTRFRSDDAVIWRAD